MTKTTEQDARIGRLEDLCHDMADALKWCMETAETFPKDGKQVIDRYRKECTDDKPI